MSTVTQDPAEPSREQRIWQVVAMIPKGSVATYGQVADLAAIPRGARQVGRAMSHLPGGTKLPWHRVINAAGRLSLKGPDYQRQKQRLEAEGVTFLKGRVSLARFRWQP